jgi:uncharacterized surface protein with fasciclin (FAS1) repeats
VVVASFDGPDSVKNWVSVNDGVMGGISDGSFAITSSKALLFKGKLSLANNGGFASIRTNPSKLNLKGASDLIVKARGDGRTYWAEVRTPRQFGAISYRAYLKTVKGTFQETRISFSDFKLQAFGRTIPGRPVDPSEVVSIGFTLADKQAGPFSLEIQYVKAAFDGGKGGDRAATGTIPEVAKKAGSFKTLLTALDAVGFSQVLAGQGPFTVFAPTDAAFSQLPKGTVETLLIPGNKAQLVDILKYHVLSGQVPLSQALEAGKATTLQGAPLTIEFSDKHIRIGPAILRHADVSASNGVIHVIDSVLIPPKAGGRTTTPQGLVQLAIERGVPLFNNGNPGACADVYEVACEGLLLMGSIPADSRKHLGNALVKMRAARSPSQKAWILRYALDRFMAKKPLKE